MIPGGHGKKASWIIGSTLKRYRNIGFGFNLIFSGVKSSMKVFIAVLFGLISAAVGIGFSFFNPGMGPVMSISIIGAGIIYFLSKKKGE